MIVLGVVNLSNDSFINGGGKSHGKHADENSLRRRERKATLTLTFLCLDQLNQSLTTKMYFILVNFKYFFLVYP